MAAPTVFPLQPVRTAESVSSLPYHPRFQGRAKRGRGKVVSWPPEDQICQVRFFLPNDMPSALGPVQAMFSSSHSRSFSIHHGCLDELSDIPPGFQGLFAKRAKVNSVVEVPMSVGVSWFSPQKLVHDSQWLVANGDESKEVMLQKERELRVLEAFYPRSTSVPNSSLEPVDSSRSLDDNVIPIVPLVSIEDEDENGEGSEDSLKEEVNSDTAVAGYGKLNNERKPQLVTAGCVACPRDSGKFAQEPPIRKADSKAMAAAAAAACMAMRKIGASGVTDQELLIQILQNPAFLENLSAINNATRKDLAGPAHGKETSNVRHSNRDSLNRNKAPANTGLPSPVSVLSDWTQEHSTNFLSRNLPNPSDFSNPSNATIVSVPSNLPFVHSRSTYPSRENVTRPESVSASSEEVLVFTPESGVSMKVPQVLNKACAQSVPVAYADRSCGMSAPPAPFPAQHGTNSNSMSKWMQPAHAAASNARVMYDMALCRSSIPDARLIDLQNDNSCLGSTSKMGLKSARLCMFYNTPRGCRNGGNCAFLHQSLHQELNPIAQ